MCGEAVQVEYGSQEVCGGEVRGLLWCREENKYPVVSCVVLPFFVFILMWRRRKGVIYYLAKSCLGDKRGLFR